MYAIAMMFLFFGILISSFSKAALHLDYLKEIYPLKYKEYPDYFSIFKFNTLNIGLQALIFPYFNRDKQIENEKARSLAVRVNRLNSIYICILILTVFFTFFIISHR
jgi:hypothetical protein